MARGRPALSAEAKLLKKLPTGLQGDIDQMGTAQLRQLIVSKSMDLETLKDEERNDEDLQSAKDSLKDLSASYKDGKSALGAAIRYALIRLEASPQ